MVENEIELVHGKPESEPLVAMLMKLTLELNAKDIALRNLWNVLGPTVPRILEELPLEKSGPAVEWKEALEILKTVMTANAELTGACHDAKRAGQALIDEITDSSAKLVRGRVWCLRCGFTTKVNARHCMAFGWPKHCGETMSIDSPEERAALSSNADVKGDPLAGRPL